MGGSLPSDLDRAGVLGPTVYLRPLSVCLCVVLSLSRCLCCVFESTPCLGVLSGSREVCVSVWRSESGCVGPPTDRSLSPCGRLEVPRTPVSGPRRVAVGSLLLPHRTTLPLRPSGDRGRDGSRPPWPVIHLVRHRPGPTSLRDVFLRPVISGPGSGSECFAFVARVWPTPTVTRGPQVPLRGRRVHPATADTHASLGECGAARRRPVVRPGQAGRRRRRGGTTPPVASGLTRDGGALRRPESGRNNHKEK